MQKFTRVMLAAIMVFVLGVAGKASAAEEKFDGGAYNLKGNLWTVQELKGYINADEFEDTVKFIVERRESDNKAERMWFEVQPGYQALAPNARKPRPFLVPLPEGLGGYSPLAELKNFVPGEKEQVFLTFDTAPGGPKAFAVIQIRADDVRRDARFLFDSRTMLRAILSGNFIGKFRATLRVEDTGTNFLLDLSGKKDFYMKERVYDHAGKILKPVFLAAKKYDDISLGKRDEHGITQLNAVIELYGVNDADHVATVNCVMKYDPAFSTWKVIESQVFPAEHVKFVEQRKK